MKDFLKYTLASIVGILASTIIVTIISIIAIASLAFSTESTTTISKSSIFKLELKGEITERMIDNPLASLMNEERTALGLNDILTCIQKAADNEHIKGIYLAFLADGVGEPQRVVTVTHGKVNGNVALFKMCKYKMLLKVK